MRRSKAPYPVYTDEDLMRCIAQGQEQAFDQLYQRYSGRMLNYFYRMLNHQEDVAHDFLQELFIRIIEKPHLYDPTKKFSTWLYAIASNMVKNEYRRRDVRKIMSNHGDMAHLTVSELMDELRIDRETFEGVLQNELTRLSENHREVFVLRFQEGMSIREISQIMTCSEGTVKSRIFYALKKLANSLKAFDPRV
ncbi:RNA polymerase sigma factor [Pontibacter sp. G13]|uniref:RNA polymerase sigma factor n=1 Tax=Pontibacter sp. G13 TaxID=3074898 RepID=UPI00288B0F7A|nr:RNA polymerase sigma factor [Pontibacter sp. G13]WNJ20891.1 RNA polymerase sigma factor [Pontibacter sp. G13]